MIIQRCVAAHSMHCCGYCVVDVWLPSNAFIMFCGGNRNDKHLLRGLFFPMLWWLQHVEKCS